MTYRNGTYVAFHAGGTTNPTVSDIKYFNLLKAWHQDDGVEFRFVNSHDKVAAVKDSSKADTIKRSLRERLDNSKNILLIVTKITKLDTDFLPYEINYAAGKCRIPIIAAYPDFNVIREPARLSSLWPAALNNHIQNSTASVIHVPFNRNVIADAIGQFSHLNLPKGGGFGTYSDAAYRSFGII